MAFSKYVSVLGAGKVFCDELNGRRADEIASAPVFSTTEETELEPADYENVSGSLSVVSGSYFYNRIGNAVNYVALIGCTSGGTSLSRIRIFAPTITGFQAVYMAGTANIVSTATNAAIPVGVVPVGDYMDILATPVSTLGHTMSVTAQILYEASA